MFLSVRSLRSLASRPVVSAVAVATLALGLGVNTSTMLERLRASAGVADAAPVNYPPLSLIRVGVRSRHIGNGHDTNGWSLASGIGDTGGSRGPCLEQEMKH